MWKVSRQSVYAPESDGDLLQTQNGPRSLFGSRAICLDLDSLDVLGLPALGTLGHVELHGLAFLQAAEAACLNSGKMYENIFAILTADKAKALGVVKPLHCSLFCHLIFLFPVFELC